MKITDFQVGQTVFVMGPGQTPKTKYQTDEAKVVKVGQKFVTINGNSSFPLYSTSIFQGTPESCPYLIERATHGEARLLFPSKQAAEEYCERDGLKRWLWQAVGWEKADAFTLDQLREVKKILEAKPPGDADNNSVTREGRERQ